MMKINRWWVALATGILLASCEKEFIPEITVEAPQLVVEGYIEAGDRPRPPYVILTRNVPFFSELDAEELGDLFVHGARVRVSDGDRTVVLDELCLSQLTPEQKQLASAFLGVDPDSLGVEFCAYTDLQGQMPGKEGKTYELQIEAEGENLSAITSIPSLVPLDSLRFVEPPGEPTDTLAQLRVFLSDPAGTANFYRYFTGTNGGPVQAGLNSVLDDQLFDGRQFEFPLLKAEPRNADFDPATFGLFRRGDTVTVKWAAINQAHYDFWNTLEFNAANQGPFSSYTRVASNVEGGLGIWGGVAAYYYTRVVPEE